MSSIFAVLFTMFYHDLTSSLPSFLIFLPICSIVMYETQRQSISLFLLTQSQKNLLEENERLAAETHANELRHMIGNVAHDLKTPLSAFVNGVDMVLDIITEIELFHQTVADKLPLQAKRAVTTMKEAVANMKNTNEFMIMTINRCIDYTKASQGLKLVPRLETIRFLEAINLPLNCMKGLQDNRVVIKLLPVSNNIASHIITDKQWLQENILCLLSNAVKYSAGGEVNVSAVLHTDGNSATRNCKHKSESASQRRPDPTKNGFIRIEVEDTGIGIAEEMRMNLFCQFKQAQRLAGGTGLGLYSLAKRIETLGGTYGVNSRKDGAQGSLFWFTIPYRPDEQLLSVSNSISVKHKQIALSSLLTETADPSLADSPGHLQRVKSLRSENVDAVDSFRKGLNILVVDDSVSILKMSSMMLRRQGHTVTTADNGAVALRILTDQMLLNNSINNGNNSSGDSHSVLFDVVLMDLQMPIMDGLEATSRLRKLEKSPNKQDSALCTEVLNTVHKQYGDASQQIARHQLILGVSANSDNETMEAAFTAGIDAFIPKPFNMQCFNEVYSNLLAKQNKV